MPTIAVLEDDQRRVTAIRRAARSAWLLDRQTDWTVEQYGGEDYFQRFDEDRIVLLRLRAKRKTDDGQFISDPEPCRGLMVWLEAN